MQAEKVTTADALKEIREELTRLGDRVAALEDTLCHGRPGRASEQYGRDARATQPAPQVKDAPPADQISEEILLVLSAAVAAFLGKKPHIRQIRLLGPTGWAQQGRVTIQASHALAARHARS